MAQIRHIIVAAAVMLGGALCAQDPFGVTAVMTAGPPPIVSVRLSIPKDHYLYAEMLSVDVASPAGVTLTPRGNPTPKSKFDELLEQTVTYYGRDTTLTYEVTGMQGTQLALTIGYQGCDATSCFLPQTRDFILDTDTPQSSASLPADVAPSLPEEGNAALSEWRRLADGFEVAGTATGYMNSKAFLTFLKQSEDGTAPEMNILQRVFNRFGIVVALLVVIPLGLLLNLTPCVLPMIPINLAIIGAGNAAGAKGTGFFRGLAYGTGMALVYGVLGLIVVLTGSQFGALNASPWFNLTIAVVFIALGLAMFDVFLIDLSRFQRAGPTSAKGASSPFVTAFVLGGTAALLAGACVAPVLIWVLVLATDLYTKGNVGGLLLPFMLGVGMALPWPIAGAGLAVIPRPGGWMNTVKHGFGILIFLFALYYGVLGARLFMLRTESQPDTAESIQSEPGWFAHLQTGMEEARRQGKPVLLDYWALSCKSCIKMKKTTFKDTVVLNALEGYVKIALQTDDMTDPVIKDAVERYGVLGLPTYVILRPLE